MALASEIWRTFLVLMILALMAEALLCVPEKQVSAAAPKVSAVASESRIAAPEQKTYDWGKRATMKESTKP
jgi:hypothetical protein